MRQSFVCNRCGVVLDDGVDYTWCPACGGTVAKLDIAPREPAAAGWSVDTAVRRLALVVLVVQALLAVTAPDAFPYLKTWLVTAQIAGVAIVVFAVMLAPDVLALARDRRTRILHGLEHATINLLLERGFPVQAGRTYEGAFVIRIAHDGRSWDRLPDVRNTAREAIDRVAAGEHALAYSPNCGTSWLVGYCLFALAVVGAGATALVLDVPTGIAFAGTVTAGLVARALKRPLGLWVQRHLTVSTDLLAASIEGIKRSVTPDGDTMVVTVSIDVTPRPTSGGVVIPFVG